MNIKIVLSLIFITNPIICRGKVEMENNFNVFTFGLLSSCDISREKCGWKEKNGTLYRISFEGKKYRRGCMKSERERKRIRHKIREKLEKAHYRSEDRNSFYLCYQKAKLRERNDWKDYRFVCFPFLVLLTTFYDRQNQLQARSEEMQFIEKLLWCKTRVFKIWRFVKNKLHNELLSAGILLNSCNCISFFLYKIIVLYELSFV